MLATLGLAAWLYFSEGPSGRILGFAEAEMELVAAVEIGRVASIQVEVGAEVAPGQVVAVLDSAAIDAELKVARAEEARLLALIPAEQARLEEEIQMGLESLQRELAHQREEQRRIAAEGEALTSEISRMKRLVEDKQASLDDLSPLDLQRASVEALAGEKPRTLELLRAQIAAAEERRKKIRERAGPETGQIEADLAVTRQEIEHLELRRAQQTLRATRAGRVSTIYKRSGDVAAPGDPIVDIASTRGRIVACVPERSAVDLQVGDTAKLWVRGRSGAPLTGRTAGLGPLVLELPIRCRTLPSVPVWGRLATIELDHPFALLAGQAFDVAFSRSPASLTALTAPAAPASPAASAPAAAAAPPRAGAADGVPMAVPPALRARTRFEPSGILPRAAEARYVVVSDDTGHGAGEGAPWLFAMSATGAVDPEPLPVSGVSELNDIESIAAGDGGEVYLLSSQGYSAKGKRKASRTALLRVKPDGRGFRVDAEVHLAELLDAAGPAALSALGLPGGTRPLEIEGMAYRDGALYFGLKAPLDADGNALIWRLDAPRALFDARKLEGAGLSLWARARVDVELAGGPAPGGISDLCFLPDGSLAIASTPSTADGAAGALFRVERPGPGALAPRLVRRFPGQKPEGIAPSLSPGKLMVVFDAGADVPSFLELPWQG
ncbi:esterase-like activity of phytase family protein [Sorangium sp. So ce131]|uniref:esterase-like activity of phytase family protein n=1 Tax=Sorangium sp. So ce131 TaxID=3133282 RepID=UPI003F5E71FF